MLMESSRLVGVAEAAEILEVDRATVTRWLRQGKIIAAHKLPGSNGAWLMPYASVAHLAAQRRKGSL